jgi:hypothetical protein
MVGETRPGAEEKSREEKQTHAPVTCISPFSQHLLDSSDAVGAPSNRCAKVTNPVRGRRKGNFSRFYHISGVFRDCLKDSSERLIQKIGKMVLYARESGINRPGCNPAARAETL